MAGLSGLAGPNLRIGRASGSKETAAIGESSSRESADWPGREQGVGLISQKRRRRRLRGRCEEADRAAHPDRARRHGGDGLIGAHSDRFHQQLSQQLSLREAIQSQPHDS